MTATKLSKDLVAASATPLVLSILVEGESYGYAIVQRVKELSDGQIAWADGMLYPLLHRLEDRGLVRSRWRRSETGRRRKYYAVTAAGRRALAKERRHWRTVTATLARLFGDPA